ncbi:MAG: cardiolipin synthase [Verrucomicrobiota bacterium JB023]|nr:cardiolipin synthase [Verrucomicrobiota bacterium JB023]
MRLLLHLVLHLAGFVFSIQAVMQSRTEQGAVAWALSLNTAPIVAVPAWLVFGYSEMDSYNATRQAGLEKTRPFAEKLIGHFGNKEMDSSEAREEQAFESLATIASLPFIRGNEVELLVDGKNTYRSIFEAIDEAQDYILIQFYILRDDEAGGELKERLIAKAREGVRVFLLIDDYGSLHLPGGYLSELREAGVAAHYFMDLGKNANRFQLNYRNHRKIVVVDGHTGFVGGHNVGDEYRGQHPVLTPWRDSHIRITGPAVKTLQIPFIEDWQWATGKVPAGLNWEVAEDEMVGGKEVLILASGPADPMESCSLFFLTMINEAQERLWIASPYFVPDDKMVTALQLAALRGVDVRILMPDLIDSTLVHYSSFSYLEDLEMAGIRAYRYQKGFMHQKVVLVDDSLSAVGSANFDNRSFRLNFEVTGIVRDREFNAEIADMLEEDFANSKLAPATDYTEKGFFFRLRVRLARLLAPIQ